MTTGIYEIKNRQNGKAYGGNSTDIEGRWNGHRHMLRNGCHHSPHFQHAWDLYGEGAFEFRILEVIQSRDERVAAEQGWLDECHAAGTCYNIARDATAPMLGRTHTDEALRKMRGRVTSDEQRREQSKRMMGNQNALGHTVSDGARSKIGAAAMGNQNMLGHKHTDAAKQKMSDAHKGKPLSDEHKCKLRQALMGNQNAAGNQAWLGREHTEEAKLKNRLAHIGKKHTSATKQKMSDARMGNQYSLGHKQSDDHKRKRGISMKRWWARKREADSNARQNSIDVY